jgi:cupin 2 domain-containing protein
MAVIKPISLSKSLPEVLNEEVFETLLSRPGIHLERILSKGQKTPEGTWYDQSEDEWVLLIQGRAQLCIEGQNALVHLAAGDSLWLPAHCRHRVEWTDPNEHCIWLALHLAVEP